MAGAGACAPDRLVKPSLPGASGREEKGVDVFLIYDIGKSAGIVEHPAFLNKPRTVAPVRGFFMEDFQEIPNQEDRPAAGGVQLVEKERYSPFSLNDFRSFSCSSEMTSKVSLVGLTLLTFI